MTPLKCLSRFWRTLEMPLINCEINLILTWSAKLSAKFLIVSTTFLNQDGTFAITDTKRYTPVENLSTQDNVKLLDQLKSCFKRTINRNKYQLKLTIQTQNQDLNYLIESGFQGVYRTFCFVDWRCTPNKL